MKNGGGFHISDLSFAKYRIGTTTCYLSDFPIRTKKLYVYRLSVLPNGNFNVTVGECRGETIGMLVSPTSLSIREYSPYEVQQVSDQDFLFSREDDLFTIKRKK